MQHSRSLIASLAYVGSIYLSNSFLKTFKDILNKYDSEQGKKKTHYKFTRDDPYVIKTRIVFVSISTLLTYLFFFYYQDSGLDAKKFIELMQFQHGLIPTWNNASKFLKEVSNFVVLYLILYAGEIVDNLIVVYNSPIQTSVMIKNFIADIDIWFVRNFIFAPITEEIVFTLIVQEDYNNKVKFINSILYFGIAHVHHGYELYVDENNAYSLANIAISCLFQMIYTSIFGHLNNIIYSRKSKYSKVVNCICTHAVCNYLGFPSLKSNGLYFSSSKKTKKILYLYEALHALLLLLGLYVYIRFMFWTWFIFLGLAI